MAHGLPLGRRDFECSYFSIGSDVLVWIVGLVSLIGTAVRIMTRGSAIDIIGSLEFIGLTVGNLESKISMIHCDRSILDVLEKKRERSRLVLIYERMSAQHL